MKNYHGNDVRRRVILENEDALSLLAIITLTFLGMIYTFMHATTWFEMIAGVGGSLLGFVLGSLSIVNLSTQEVAEREFFEDELEPVMRFLNMVANTLTEELDQIETKIAVGRYLKEKIGEEKGKEKRVLKRILKGYVKETENPIVRVIMKKKEEEIGFYLKRIQEELSLREAIRRQARRE